MKNLFCLFTMVSIVFVSGSFAVTWTVSMNDRADFDGIQDAVMDDRVESGHTILVYPGVYEETVWIPADKELVIRSVAGFEHTIIRRPQKLKRGPQMTVLIKSRSVFEGFTVDDPNGTIWPLTTLETLPARGQILENTAAITLTGPAIVLNNRVSGHRFGILQECPAGATGTPSKIRFNISEYNDIGIGCCETHSTVRDNIVRNNFWVGILSAHSSCDDIVNNLVIGNGTPGREASAGILLWQSYTWQPFALNPRIAMNTVVFNEGDGILCIYEKGAPILPVLEHSIIAMNSGVGIRVVETDEPGDLPRLRIFRCNIWNNGIADTENTDRLIDCMSEDPLLVDGFRLDYNSPCINRGSIPDNLGSTSPDGSADRGRINLGFHYPVSILQPPGVLD
jgi:hypothetical protein